MNDPCLDCPFTRDAEQGMVTDPHDWVQRFFWDHECHKCPESGEYCAGQKGMVRNQCNGFMYPVDFGAEVEQMEQDYDLFFSAPHEFMRYHLGNEGDLYGMEWRKRWKNGEWGKSQQLRLF